MIKREARVLEGPEEPVLVEIEARAPAKTERRVQRGLREKLELSRKLDQPSQPPSFLVPADPVAAISERPALKHPPWAATPATCSPATLWWEMPDRPRAPNPGHYYARCSAPR